MSLMSFNSKMTLISKAGHYVALGQNMLTLQYMVVHLFLALTVSIRWRLLFPTLCWSINTKSMVTTLK
jgi:hypothetical protein